MRKALAALVGLVVVAVLAVVASDAPLRAEVERRVAAEVATSVPFSATPSVELGGYPFAWHAVTRQFPTAHIRAAGMPMRIGEHRATLADVDVTLVGVDARQPHVKARTVEGTAVLTYADLSAVARLPISGSNGRLTATYETSVLGVPVRVVASGQPTLDPAAQAVSLEKPDLQLAGRSIGPEASQALLDALVKPVAVPLDYGLKLVRVTAGSDGLHISFDGTDVAFG